MSLLLRVLGILIAAFAVAALIVWLNFDSVRYNVIIWVATPTKPFAEPKGFDYASDEGWIARPANGAGTGPAVDVFFVIGTTYFKPYHDSWNQPADDVETNKINTQFFGKLPAYADCCALYAPRIRQAILGAFARDTDDTRKALDLAYADVERAFDYFIQHNNGRPFILAGASQGSRHIFALLKSRISGTALKDRMVAAYPLIWWMKKAQFATESPDIPICNDAKQTGCVVTFNPVGPHLRTGLNPLFDQTGIICVNPLTWHADGAQAGFELNLGARKPASPDKLVPGAADARCDENGRLVVSEIRTDMYEGVPLPLRMIMNVFGRDNYHSLAGGLFYANLKQNAEDRTQAYLAAHPAK
ncbi:MAG: DUF3089 domain-containing protein [Alphaproteobacteria bacterium]|nr:DUF3089 domain-containing protein [Alphaproteobacteria bacterium]